jgi:hypothetical protein
MLRASIDGHEGSGPIADASSGIAALHLSQPKPLHNGTAKSLPSSMGSAPPARRKRIDPGIWLEVRTTSFPSFQSQGRSSYLTNRCRASEAASSTSLIEPRGAHGVGRWPSKGRTSAHTTSSPASSRPPPPTEPLRRHGCTGPGCCTGSRRSSSSAPTGTGGGRGGGVWGSTGVFAGGGGQSVMEGGTWGALLDGNAFHPLPPSLPPSLPP